MSLTKVQQDNLRSFRDLKRLEGRKIRARRANPQMRHPDAAELEYKAITVGLVRDVRKALNEFVIPELAMIVEFRENSRIDSVAERWDGIAEIVQKIMRPFAVRLGFLFGDKPTKNKITKVAADISRFAQRELDRFFKLTVGVDATTVIGMRAKNAAVRIAEDEAAKGFISEGTALIKSIESRQIDDVEKILFRAFRTQQSTTDIAKELQRKVDIEENRAKLIARDQTAKFNGKVNEDRQRAAGIDEYIWSTSLDERVRDEHAEREGEVFSWDDPPFDGPPGVPINCRCVAKPKVDELSDILQ